MIAVSKWRQCNCINNTVRHKDEARRQQQQCQRQRRQARATEGGIVTPIAYFSAHRITYLTIIMLRDCACTQTWEWVRVCECMFLYACILSTLTHTVVAIIIHNLCTYLIKFHYLHLFLHQFYCLQATLTQIPLPAAARSYLIFHFNFINHINYLSF